MDESLQTVIPNSSINSQRSNAIEIILSRGFDKCDDRMNIVGEEWHEMEINVGPLPQGCGLSGWEMLWRKFATDSRELHDCGQRGEWPGWHVPEDLVLTKVAIL